MGETPCKSETLEFRQERSKIKVVRWSGCDELESYQELKGYLAHKKTPTLLGPRQDPRHRLTVGSRGGVFSYERGTGLSRVQGHTKQGHTLDAPMWTLNI